MAKKPLKIKVLKGTLREDGKLVAVLPEPLPGLEKKLTFINRQASSIGTGLEVKVPEGYHLCFRINPALAVKGMVASNAPGHVVEGEVQVCVVNSGRETIEIREGDYVADFWLSPVANWEAV